MTSKLLSFGVESSILAPNGEKIRAGFQGFAVNFVGLSEFSCI